MDPIFIISNIRIIMPSITIALLQYLADSVFSILLLLRVWDFIFTLYSFVERVHDFCLHTLLGF